MRGALVFFLVAGATLAAMEDEGARFKEGVGITLAETTRHAMGLKTAWVEERAVSNALRITAQVYRDASETSQNQDEPSGYAYASAWIDSRSADALTPGLPLAIAGRPELAASVLRLDRTAAEKGGCMELLIQIQDRAHSLRVGEFVRVRSNGGAGNVATVIPSSAVLNTVYGDFVYVVNGDAYLRTGIQRGAGHDDVTEILDGLYAGDEVVTHPVETLYIIELRATKGGGHSH